MVQAQGYYPDRLVQPRAGQAYCGLPVPRPRSPLGVDPPLPGHGHYFPNARSPLRGSVCVGTLCPAPEVLCAGSGSGSVANRAFSVRWEVFTGYVFPPTHPPNSTEGEAGSGYRPPHCPVVAEENVVPRMITLVVGYPRTLPVRRDVISQPIPGTLHPRPSALHLTAWPLSGRPELRQAFLKGCGRCCPQPTGFYPRGVHSRLAGFFSWCESQGVDPRSAPLTDVAVFLSSLFDKGRLVF